MSEILVTSASRSAISLAAMSATFWLSAPLRTEPAKTRILGRARSGIAYALACR